MSEAECHVAASLRRLSLGLSALALPISLGGCGDYDPPATTSSSGQNAAMGALTPSGRAGAGGSSAGGNSAGGSSASSSAAGSSAAGSSSAGSGGTGALDVEPVEASCQAVTPCGGNVAGTWVAAGPCLPVSGMADVAGFGLGCAAAAVTGMLEVTGTWTANADGTFRDQTITSGDSQLAVPSECLNVSGTVTTCDRLGGAFQALGYASVTCENAASGGGCTCLASAEQAGGLGLLAVGAASSGSYTSSNGVLSTSAGREAQYAYCVSGNTLVLTPQSTGQTGALTGTIVLVKQ